MIEEDNPNQVNPTPDRDDDRENDAKDVAGGRLFDDRGHTNVDINDPVNEGDEKEDDLDKAGLAIEPFH